MAILFPQLRPTARTYEAPSFAQLTPQYVNAISYPRLLGSRPGKARLILSFENIPDSEAALIVAAYLNSLTGFLPLLLPIEVVAGIDSPDLATKIQTGEHLEWYFDGPPRQSSVKAGISSVQVELAGDF